MGLWDDLKKVVQQSGQQAMKKADEAINAVQKSVVEQEAAHQQKLDNLLADMTSGKTDLTAEQLAHLRKFAFKPGKTVKPGDPPSR